MYVYEIERENIIINHFDMEFLFYFLNLTKFQFHAMPVYN